MSAIAATRTGLGGMVLHPSGLGLGRFVVRIRTVQPHPVGAAVLVELGADHVPALAEVQHAVVQFGGPAPGRDADSFPFAHQSVSLMARTASLLAR